MKLREAVTVSGILQHERVLQKIANNFGGTRAAGTPGYTASAAYVKARLKLAGYKVTEQPFEFEFYQEVTPSSLSQVSPTPQDYDTSTFTYSGSGGVLGGVVAATNTLIPATSAPSSAAGCATTDFVPASATTPQVALIQRGTCTFGEKAHNVIAAGYDAVIIFNEGNPGRTELVEGTLGATVSVPVVGLGYADSAALYASAQAGPTTVVVSTEVIAETRTTANIIADTQKGNKDKVIVVGTHLDSVLATAPTAFDGRSDYGPCIAVGFPAGGLFSGTDGLKTPRGGRDLRWNGRRCL